MAYVKNNWVDQSVERPKTYEMTNNSDGSVTLIDSFGLVSELGTPVNADNMNHIEEGIAGCDLRKHNLTETFQKGEWVTGIVEDTKGIYESLKDNNYGNPLTDETSWKKVELGGGGSGFNLFDMVIKDHILTYEESKGFALQGTYVYKTPVAGSRYGYPDFYAKCIEEKNSGTATQTTLGGSTITMYVNANGHQFYDIADKAAVDTFFDTYGVADFYGVDEANERVFLPRNRWFMQLTTDTSKVNQFNEAGLPNITGAFSLRGTEYAGDLQQGAFYQNGQGGAAGTGHIESAVNPHMYFDASLSNPIYGNSDTVQPPSSNKLLYYVVGNTEIQSAVTNVVDITTSENDTIPLFTGMWFDFNPSHPSWLKAGEQANSGGIYTTCYNTLVNCLTGTNPYNLKVVEESAMVSGTDYSEYWKVNQDGMYFVTPTKISYFPINKDNAPVVGNGNALGLMNYNATGGVRTGALGYLYDTGISGWDTSFAIVNRDPSTLSASSSANISSYGYNNGLNGNKGLVAVGVTTDPSKSGIIADLSSAKSTTAQLYFKVANAVENLELLDVGKVTEALTTKIDMAQAASASAPTAKKINLTVGESGAAYVAPETGWFYVYRPSTDANGGISLYTYAPDGSSILGTYTSAPDNGGTIAYSIFINKGDTLKYYYTGNSNGNYMTFHYAKGVE